VLELIALIRMEDLLKSLLHIDLEKESHAFILHHLEMHWTLKEDHGKVTLL